MNEYMNKMVTDLVKNEIKTHIMDNTSDNASEYQMMERMFWSKYTGLKLLGITRADNKAFNHGGCEHMNVVCETGYDTDNGMKATVMKLEAKFSFKAKKYENNILFYEICIYSDGSVVAFYDGEGYEK